MYLLVCLAVLGAAVAVPLESTSVERNDALYVLPTETFPTFYDVRLFLDPGKEESFSGDVSIRIASYVETNKIVLHAMAMELRTIELYRQSEFTDEAINLYREHNLATDDTHLLTITTTEALQPLQPYTLKISFTGHYAENMFGIYLSKYEDGGETQSLITSQLQPTFARRAFPCYDEPAQKAIFRTTIYAPPAYPVVKSNTVLRTDSLKEEVAGWVKYEFEDTLVMSTYLLAYLVSNFKSIDNSENPIYHIPFSVFSRPGTQKNAEFALQYGQENMVALETYTEFEYKFPKMDKVAVPDFAAGAMENWGLVIYREVALLVQKGVTTTSVKQNIGRIICHENVHQWFGNEVSPQSWTFTWLNEGFANFFENFATDLVLKDWRMMDQFVIALQNVFQSDAVLSVNPMTHTVRTPSEILGTFNAVAYQKSGSVIRMMQHFLTPEVFRKGLALYIKKNSRKAAAPADLYAALQEALDESSHEIPFAVSTVMNRWANQGGFPVIKVRKTSPSSNSVSVTQERYLTDSSLTSNERWHIPLNWVLSGDLNFEDTRPQFWMGSVTTAQSIDIPGLNSTSWFIFNKQQTGYYRVDYEPSNWEALAGVLRSNHLDIHVLNRAQLLDDSFNLARNGRLSYINALELSLYLDKEDDYIPWAAVNPAFSYLDLALNGLPAHALFKTYLLNITAPLYAKLGFDDKDGEEHVTPYHRNIILNINCQHGNEDCISAAQEKLQNFRNNPDEYLNPDIQTTVFCSGLRGGDEDNFNFLWSQYLKSNEASQQSTLLSALGCTSNPTLRTFYMDQVINDDSPVREQDRHSILVSVINSSPENADAALDFITDHWPDIQPRVQGLTGTTNILNAFARRLTTVEHATKLEAFATKHENIFTAGELASIAGIRENIDASIAWSNSNAAVVEDWLDNKFGIGSASGLTAGLLVFLSFAVAIFNYQKV